MATVDFTALPTDMVTTTSIPRNTPQHSGPQWHRIRTVRLQQGASLRSVARNSGVDIRQLREQEQESSDLRISDLHRWHQALDVPLSELLVEPDSALSHPVLDRARMVRLMKTATAIRERSEAVGIRRMAQMLCEQLTEIMPELAEVGPWHDYGQRRGLDEFGRIVDRTIPDELLVHAVAD
jgi:transcriptional regulator with XRE-family HTH domain